MEEAINSQNIQDDKKARQLKIRMNQIQPTTTFYKIFVLVSAGMFLDAIDVYLASGVSSYLLETNWSTLKLNSIFLAVGFFGLFLGSVFAGVVGDFFGRKKAYQLNLIVFGSFTLIGSFAPNMYFLIVCRLIASIGLGTEIVTGYAMINEFAPVKSRGKWCALTSFIANCGAPITMLMCTLLIPHFTWRIMFIISGISALILWYFRRKLPESPRWSIAHGRIEEAQGVINEIENEMKDEGVGKAQINSKINSAEVADEINSHFGRNLLVAIFAVSATIVCQYTFTSWVPTLLVKQGINIVSSLGFTTVMMMGAPAGAFLGSQLVDRIGRKPTIVTAFILAAILGIIYSRQTDPTIVMALGFLLTTCFYVLMASVVGVYVSELFTTKYRFRGAGIANGISKLITVGMPIGVAWLLSISNTTMIFTVISSFAVIAAIIVYFFGPETNNQEVD
ncbi:MFS transporter [Liquorilactobacillus mali]|uniref:Transport protein n=1 Tax=Liquorilactobacillus mali KCTC 3596 = DSM 20444 TaxID=1046596 RepID=J0L2Y1_9LACO|nr:MFS transporter [Liquorilactobacillus mali]EJE97285.1 Transport protein [Liquorilactobacillus mali KCTC 3596 = DSM 20444]KRN11328.1 transport protein [Liquorilactobacillus mali KCTC 3596 = DSM 20444]MDC7953167.1 MFS transporter [Liquorilactobacillus mali]MDV7757240.1 MFS transporter [Liquorilactobacillus mali]QFQ75335.1 MFS transporter [Liquorilactobacillus mali]